MSKPTTSKADELRREDQSRAMTHTALVHAAFMKLVNEALYPKTDN